MICVLYRPPDNSKHLDKNFESSLDDMLSLAANECKEIILLGDSNVNYLINNDHVYIYTIRIKTIDKNSN